jgi:hypothetical protein
LGFLRRVRAEITKIYTYPDQPPTWRAAFRAEYGDPDKRYQWEEVYLPNGTELEMEHDGQRYKACVRREAIRRDVREVEEYSPAEIATAIGGGTPRDRWHDLFMGLSAQTAEDLHWRSNAVRHHRGTYGR